MSQKVKGKIKAIFTKKTSSGNIQAGDKQDYNFFFGKDVLKVSNLYFEYFYLNKTFINNFSCFGFRRSAMKTLYYSELKHSRS